MGQFRSWWWWCPPLPPWPPPPKQMLLVSFSGFTIQTTSFDYFYSRRILCCIMDWDFIPPRLPGLWKPCREAEEPLLFLLLWVLWRLPLQGATHTKLWDNKQPWNAESPPSPALFSPARRKRRNPRRRTSLFGSWLSPTRLIRRLSLNPGVLLCFTPPVASMLRPSIIIPLSACFHYPPLPISISLLFMMRLLAGPLIPSLDTYFLFFQPLSQAQHPLLRLLQYPHSHLCS